MRRTQGRLAVTFLIGVHGRFDKLRLIVDKLEEAEKGLDNECALALKEFELHKCKKDFTVEENRKVIDENQGRVESLTSDITSISTTDQTDEAEKYEHKINAAETAMKAAKQAKNAADLDCQNKANKADAVIRELGAFYTALNVTSLLQKKPRELLSHAQLVALGKDVSTDQMKMILNLERETQAPEKYESSRGALADLVLEIKRTWTQKKQDDESVCSKDSARRQALINNMDDDIEALNDAANNGNGEKAAKEEAVAQLQEEIDTLNGINTGLKGENTRMMNEYSAAQTKYYGDNPDDVGCGGGQCKECQDQKAILGKAIEYMKTDRVKKRFGENQRNVGRQAVVPKEFLDTSFLQVRTGDNKKPLQLLLDAVVAQVGEKEKEITELKASEAKCDSQANASLGTAKLLAEKIDVYTNKINTMETSIMNEQATIDTKVKEMKEAVEVLAKKWKGFVEAYKVEAERQRGLKLIIEVLGELVGILAGGDDSVSGTIKEGPGADTKAAGITTLIANIKSGFAQDLQNSTKDLFEEVQQFLEDRNDAGFMLFANEKSFPDLTEEPGYKAIGSLDFANIDDTAEGEDGQPFYISLPYVNPGEQGDASFDATFKPQSLFTLVYAGKQEDGVNSAMDLSQTTDSDPRRFYCANDQEEEPVQLRDCDTFMPVGSELAQLRKSVGDSESKKANQSQSKTHAAQEKENLKAELQKQIEQIQQSAPACDFFLIRGKDKQVELRAEIGVLQQARKYLNQTITDDALVVGNSTDVSVDLKEANIAEDKMAHVGNSTESKDYDRLNSQVNMTTTLF